MRYRGYRRKCEKKKEKRLENISYFARTGCVCRKEEPGDRRYDKYFPEEDDITYFKRIWRGRRSSYLKKEYNRKLRNSSKINMEAFQGSDYKRASGDFWWDYE